MTIINSRPIIRLSILTGLLLLVLSAFAVVGCDSDESATTNDITNITIQDAVALIAENQDNPNFIILDVRTPDEFNKGHIENAALRDYYLKTFNNDLDALDKENIYLVYCRTARRSAEAVLIMDQLGFTEAYNMLGGITEWASRDLPTLAGGEPRAL